MRTGARWLHESFRDGVDERASVRPAPAAYDGANPRCYLSDWDRRQRPCSGRIERFHFIGRQRVRNALGALLIPAFGGGIRKDDPAWEVIAIAEWDARNGGHGCEAHHRRLDRQMEPTLTLPPGALPAYTVEFIRDFGLEAEAERRFPGIERPWLGVDSPQPDLLLRSATMGECKT